MANLEINNLPNPRLMLNEEDYWDFYINHDGIGPFMFNGGKIYEQCLIAYIDSSLNECMSSGTTWLESVSGYSWENSVTNGDVLENIGYTGIDNGLICYRKDRITNSEFLNYFKNSKYTIESGDTRLKLHAVSGTTQLYEYPLSVTDDKAIRLNGGFYQGFFKTTDCMYQVLPSDIGTGNTWEFEFTLKKSSLKPDSDKTLNDKYPENKGIFFYLGTRAENKWMYLYNKDDDCFTLDISDYVEDSDIDKKGFIINNFFDIDENVNDELNLNGLNIEWTVTPVQKGCGCGLTYISTSAYTYTPPSCIYEDCISHSGDTDYFCDTEYVEDELEISDFIYETSNGFTLDSANDYYFYTDNKFVLFDRTCSGYKVNNWEEGSQMMYYGKKDKFKENLFPLMNRTCSGYTVETIQKLKEKANSEYTSQYKDVYGNAFALRINENNAVGYRYLVKDCSASTEGKYSVLEGYSFDNVIPEDEWCTVHVKIRASVNTMKLFFYVDGKLVYVTKDIPKIDMHALDEISEKQEGVPYNISLGGGTQGLSETILQNYMLNPYRTYPLERIFAGTFIGYIKSFKFYDCEVEYGNIYSNYLFEIKNTNV